MFVNKEIFFAFLFSLFFLNGVYAQFNIGIDFGKTNNQLNFTSIDTALRTQKRCGYIFDVDLNYGFNKSSSLELIPSFLEKKYSLVNKGQMFYDVNNKYLQFPVNLKFYFFLKKKIRLSISLGGYCAYWLKSEIDSEVPNVFEITNEINEQEVLKLERIKSLYKFDSKYDNRLEFGLSNKTELEYCIINNIFLSVKFHYYKSLTNQQYHINEIQSTRHNQTSIFSAGVVYSIKM